MRLIDFVVELHGNGDASLNGRHAMDDSVVQDFHFDEKVFRRKVPPDQQWRILCELRKLLSRVEHAYDDGRTERNELSEGDVKRLRSGAKGVPGTSLPDLRTKT